jgi:hypothetical protein
MVRLAPNV